MRYFILPTAQREKDALDRGVFLFLRGVARDNKADEEAVVTCVRDVLATLTREALACRDCDDGTRPPMITVMGVEHHISATAFLALAAIMRYIGRRLLDDDMGDARVHHVRFRVLCSSAVRLRADF